MLLYFRRSFSTSSYHDQPRISQTALSQTISTIFCAIGQLNGSCCNVWRTGIRHGMKTKAFMPFFLTLQRLLIAFTTPLFCPSLLVLASCTGLEFQSLLWKDCLHTCPGCPVPCWPNHLRSTPRICSGTSAISSLFYRHFCFN